MSFPSTRTEQATLIDSIRAALQTRAVFFASIAMIYAAAIIAATLTLHPYFSQTWDVQTFIQAGKQFLDGRNPLALYAESRTAQTWPYAYPPLHAFVTAIALALGNLFHVLPDYVWARVPTIATDIGIAFLLHSIVRRKSNDEWIARAAALLWLFNPITFYNTAVQGHFESEWLVFVLLAYAWFEDSRSIALPAIALALAVLFKQVAIVFAIPVWVFLLKARFAGGRRKDENAQPFISRFLVANTAPRNDLHLILHPLSLRQLALSIIIFALVVGIVCLPFLLYSDDFLYMNLTYVENVPVQTQSWIVALLGLTRNAPDAMTSDFFLLRYQTIVTIVAALAISFCAARRGWGLELTATLIAIAFFLTSKKVMGYYYVMLFPFLLAELLPRRRFDLVLITIVATTYIALSPYYAAWTNHAHGWVYAVLGIINSAFFVWLFVKLWTQTASRADERREKSPGTLRTVIFITLGLFAAALFAALLQPFAPDNNSPIRAPIVTPGMEVNALTLFAGLIVLLIVTLIVIRRIIQTSGEILPLGAWGVPLIFAPLFFSVYTLTKESTTILEIVLKAWGV